MSELIVQEKNEVKAKLSDSLMDKLVSIEAALPKDFNKTRFVQNAIAVLNDKPELAKINQQMLIQGLVKGAYLGLDFLADECYLIPYGQSIEFQTSYRGEIKIVDYQGNAPHLVGKQTWLTWLEGEGTSLIFEGIHFEIIDNE